MLLTMIEFHFEGSHATALLTYTYLSYILTYILIIYIFYSFHLISEASTRDATQPLEKHDTHTPVSEQRLPFIDTTPSST